MHHNDAFLPSTPNGRNWKKAKYAMLKKSSKGTRHMYRKTWKGRAMPLDSVGIGRNGAMPEPVLRKVNATLSWYLGWVLTFVSELRELLHGTGSSIGWDQQSGGNCTSTPSRLWWNTGSAGLMDGHEAESHSSEVLGKRCWSGARQRERQESRSLHVVEKSRGCRCHMPGFGREKKWSRMKEERPPVSSLTWPPSSLAFLTSVHIDVDINPMSGFIQCLYIIITLLSLLSGSDHVRPTGRTC
jgi:hypothetical protein